MIKPSVSNRFSSSHLLRSGLLFTAGLLFLLACKHEPLLTPGPDPNDPGSGNPNPENPVTNPCSPDSVYFSNQILPILVSNCSKSGCHNEQDRADGVVLTSYNSLISTVEKVKSTDWNKNELIEVLLETDPDDRMPPAPNPALSNAQINLLKTWIQQGAQQNACDESAGECITDNLTYTNFAQNLISSKCIGCHQGSAPQGGINLSNYNDVKALAQNGKLLASIKRTSNWMPLNGQKLDACTISKLEAWINAGAPN